MTQKIEPTVPLSDLYQAGFTAGGSGLNILPPEPELSGYMSSTYGVTPVRDHRNRLAVSLADAYKVRDARMAAEAELQATWMAEQRLTESITVWGRARETYWYEQWMFVLRATPISPGEGSQQRQMNEARLTLSEMVLAAEAAAGIPPEVQARLWWPALDAAYRGPEVSERAEDFPYRAPVAEDTI